MVATLAHGLLNHSNAPGANSLLTGGGWLASGVGTTLPLPNVQVLCLAAMPFVAMVAVVLVS